MDRHPLSLVALLASGLVLVALMFPAVTARRPHIILIVADDLGWNDVSMHGSDLVPTPNMDALAAAGRLLRRHYTLPICTPSRAALLAGRHPAANGMQGYPLRAGEPRGLPLSERTLAERLRARGYATHLVGKWHLGAHRSAFLPTRRGFDSHFGYRNGYVGYFDHNHVQGLPDNQSFCGRDMWRNESPGEREVVGEYLTHAFTREATRVIREHDGEQPLFLQLAHLAVHTGNDTNHLEVPDEAAAHRRFAFEPRADRRIFAEMVSQLDDSVGAVVKALREASMLNDSIVVFFSDNGGMTVGLHQNTGSNWPFRGIKFTLYEGGVRTVGAIWSPRLRALRTPYESLLHVSDWAPTLLAAADEDTPGGQENNEINGGQEKDIFAGVNHWPALSAPAEATVTPPRESVLLNVDDVIGHSGVLSGRWKYVEGSHEGLAQSDTYDGFVGSPARGPEYPSYDAEATARVARQLGLDDSLSAQDVLKARAAAAISCKELEDTLGSPACPHGCLFDLEEDPCETRDASARWPAQLTQLRAMLGEFRAQQADQLNVPVDVKSDPSLHGGLWAPWLDDDDDDYFDDGITNRRQTRITGGTAEKIASTVTTVAAASTVAAGRGFEL